MKSVTLEIDEDRIQDVARELVSNISALDPSRSEELISGLIFELASAAAIQRQKEERRQRRGAYSLDGGGCRCRMSLTSAIRPGKTVS